MPMVPGLSSCSGAGDEGTLNKSGALSYGGADVCAGYGSSVGLFGPQPRKVSHDAHALWRSPVTCGQQPPAAVSATLCRSTLRRGQASHRLAVAMARTRPRWLPLPAPCPSDGAWSVLELVRPPRRPVSAPLGWSRGGGRPHGGPRLHAPAKVPGAAWSLGLRSGWGGSPRIAAGLGGWSGVPGAWGCAGRVVVAAWGTAARAGRVASSGSVGMLADPCALSCRGLPRAGR